MVPCLVSYIVGLNQWTYHYYSLAVEFLASTGMINIIFRYLLYTVVFGSSFKRAVSSVKVLEIKDLR